MYGKGNILQRIIITSLLQSCVDGTVRDVWLYSGRGGNLRYRKGRPVEHGQKQHAHGWLACASGGQGMFNTTLQQRVAELF